MIKPRIRKRDGRKVYDVRLRDPGGKEYSRTFETKREAEAFEGDERGARRHGSWISHQDAAKPFKVVAEEWLSADGTKRSSSVARDRSILDNHVLPAIGAKAIGAITRADMQRLVKSWTATHAPSSVDRMYAVPRAIFAFAETSDWVVKSPCRGIRLPSIEPTEHPCLSADDLEALAAELGADQATMMHVGVVLGLRWSECAGLKVSSINFLAATITVTAQLGRDRIDGPPKSSAGRRSLAVPGWLMDELAAVLARRGVTAADPDAAVFTSTSGARLHYSNWRRRVWVPACVAAGLAGLHFHDLRSMAATALVAEGVDIKTGQRRLGHSTARTFMDIYARATAEADRSAAEKMGQRFRPRDGRGMESPGSVRPMGG